MALQMYRYIIIDGHRYVVATNTYNVKWQRAFSSQLAGNIIRLNFIDRGPGIRVYDMTLILATWASGSTPHNDGITDTWDTQYTNLLLTYGKTATNIQFVDPLGQTPDSVVAINGGVFFTNLNTIIPNYSTPQKPYILMEVELTESTIPLN